MPPRCLGCPRYLLYRISPVRTASPRDGSAVCQRALRASSPGAAPEPDSRLAVSRLQRRNQIPRPPQQIQLGPLELMLGVVVPLPGLRLLNPRTLNRIDRGHAESLARVTSAFTPIRFQGAIVYQKPEAQQS